MSTRRLLRAVRDGGAEPWRSMAAAGIPQYGLRTGRLAGEIMALPLKGPHLRIPTVKADLRNAVNPDIDTNVRPRRELDLNLSLHLEQMGG